MTVCSYQTRCEAAALSFNSGGEYHRVINKAIFGNSPKTFHKKFYKRKIRETARIKAKRVLMAKRRKVFRKHLPDKDYGPNANYVPLDLNSQEYREKAADFVKTLEKTPEEIIKIERNTLGQKSNPQWLQERSLRITASNFGQICKMRPTTSPVNAVKNMLYGNFFGNKATRYGNENEPRAIAEFENSYNLKVTQSGFHISRENYFMGASPDGLVGEEGLLEVKCPFSISDQSPSSGIVSGKIKFAQLVNGKLSLKRNHNYYYQVQGQLAITNRRIGYFLIWSPQGILVEEIPRDDSFWREKMLPKLKSFYHNCLLPELVDPLHPKGLPIRDKVPAPVLS